jgi:hypothetical protein
MNIVTELYQESVKRLPKTGQYILANQADGRLIFYQAYKKSIADFAGQHQYLGGPDFSLNRMSWIKPNFLWMMYRCGWAQKENQEHVIAISIDRKEFEAILTQAVLSSFKPQYYENHDKWKDELNSKEVRLQWDPDHDPFGNKIERRAIQIGLKGEALRTFVKRIKSIEDITDFVKQQKAILDDNGLNKLRVPVESIFKIEDETLNIRICGE